MRRRIDDPPVGKIVGARTLALAVRDARERARRDVELVNLVGLVLPALGHEDDLLSVEGPVRLGVSAVARELADIAELLTRSGGEKGDEGENSHRPIVRSRGFPRSEERRVGKECRSRWSPYD